MIARFPPPLLLYKCKPKCPGSFVTMHRNASLLHETNDVLNHLIGRFLCARKVFDGVIPERADQAVGQCVKIDLEFAFCRGALAFFASAQIRMQDLRSTSFFVHESALLLSWIICTTCSRSSSPIFCRLSASFSMSIYNTRSR